jgi:hypothetical protein
VSGSERLRPIEQTGESARVWLGPTEQLVLEVRGPTGFSTDLPGHGLLVWLEHRTPAGEEVGTILVQADGRDDLANGTDLDARPVPPIDENFGDATDPFPGALGITEWQHSESGVALRDIRLDGDDVLFDIELP